MSGFDDFDFLIGEWTITNEFLKGRLVGSTDWETFPATSKVEKVMPIAGGRLCRWSRRQPRYDVRAVARFHRHDAAPVRSPGGPVVDLLVGHQELSALPTDHRPLRERARRILRRRLEGGVPVRVRFDWTAGKSPVWEQSFSTDGGKNWEKNWVMRFERA